MHAALSRQGNKNTAKLLIDAGADLDYIDDTEFTALLWAVESSEPEIVSLLVDAVLTRLHSESIPGMIINITYATSQQCKFPCVMWRVHPSRGQLKRANGHWSYCSHHGL
eukprot:374958-Pyramimonas_sp.AAC.2